MLLIITIILIFLFVLNFLLYWIIFLKTEKKITRWWDIYTNIYFIIHISTIILIPILSSSFWTTFFNIKSYFQGLWLLFLFLGIILVIIAIKFGRLTLIKINNMKGLAKGKFPLITDGPYKIMRHPLNTSWAILFLGLAMIFDSTIALIITPFLILHLELEGIMEEKFLLLPQFGEKYEKYKLETPSRLFPTPYNALLIIIAIFIVYVGVLNLFL